MRLTKLLLALAIPAGVASAEDLNDPAGQTVYLDEGTLSYDMFENAVAHVDLASCPAEFAEEEVFCRMTLANGQAHVFVFSVDSDAPLLAIKSLDVTGDLLAF